MKKNRKTEFKNIKNVLSRNEMRQIMGGYSGDCCVVCWDEPTMSRCIECYPVELCTWPLPQMECIKHMDCPEVFQCFCN